MTSAAAPELGVAGATATALDHVGVAGSDLARLAAEYERLGFTLTPTARQSAPRDGAMVPLGTANRCAMLRRGYIELIAVVDPALEANGLDRLLARYAGLHIVALAMDDEAANLARLRRAGVAIAGVAALERPVDDADPQGPRARFSRLPLPDAPEGRLQLIRHLTPGALWQERFLGHRNRAESLEAVILAVERPAETAARLSLLAGRPAVPDPDGGFALHLAGTTVRMLPAAALGRVLPGMVAPCLPFIAGMVVRTADRAAAARASGGLREAPGGALAMASGAAVLFV